MSLKHGVRVLASLNSLHTAPLFNGYCVGLSVIVGSIVQVGSFGTANVIREKGYHIPQHSHRHPLGWK